MIVKTVALRAIWQIARLGPFGLPVMIFLDEPSLLGYGSQTFLAVSREDVVGDIDEATAVIHARGGSAGVHCEENTDWSLLMETGLDILAFDGYSHMQAIALYTAELHAFLERGGWLGWGIVPTLDREAAAAETVPSLPARRSRYRPHRPPAQSYPASIAYPFAYGDAVARRATHRSLADPPAPMLHRHRRAVGAGVGTQRAGLPRFRRNGDLVGVAAF